MRPHFNTWRGFLITICIAFCLLDYGHAQEPDQNAQLRAATAGIGSIVRTKKPSRENAEKMAQHVARLREQPQASLPILLDAISDHDHETTSRLVLCHLAVAIVLENNLEVNPEVVLSGLEKEDNPTLQADMLRLLAHSHQPNLADQVVRFTRSPHENVRVATARLYGDIMQAQGISTLSAMAAQDESYLVRNVASRSLGKFKGNAAAVAALVRAFGREHSRTADEVPDGTPSEFDKEIVLMAIVSALGEIQSTEANLFLVKVLEQEQYPADVRKSAAIALGNNKVAQATEALLICSKSPLPSLRVYAAEALLSIDSSTYLPIIRDFLASEQNTFVQDRLRKSIGKAEGGDQR